MESFQQPDVAAVFDAYPAALRRKLMALRQLIFETAAATEGVGPLTETLKWGQPSYLTQQSRSGTTIRIDGIKGEAGQYGLYVHCQTSLLDTYRELYPGKLDYVGTRCVKFGAGEKPPKAVLRHCIALALTYHRRKKA